MSWVIVIGDIELTRETAVGERDLIGLGTDDGELARDQRWVGRGKTAGDHLIEAAELVFVGVTQTRRNMQTIGDVPCRLREGGVALGVRVRGGVREVAVEKI